MMADHGTFIIMPVEEPVLFDGYVADTTPIPKGVVTVIPAAEPVIITPGSYRIAGTADSSEAADRVQWFPRGDWQNDGE